MSQGPNTLVGPVWSGVDGLYATQDGGKTYTLLGGGSGTVHTSSPVSGDGSVGSPITVIGGVNPLRIGAALGNTSPTVNPGSDLASEYQLPAATLTANRAVTLGITGSPTTSLTVAIVRKDLTANTYAVVNGGSGGGTMFTFASSPAGVQCATFTFDGTNWNFVNFYYLAL